MIINKDKETLLIKNVSEKKNLSNFKDFHSSFNLLQIIKLNLINYYFFIFLISYLLYYLSLEKCMEGQVQCSKKNTWIKTKLTEAIFCSIILSFLIELVILNIISRIHLIHVLLFFLCAFIYSHGLEFYDHGLFNFLGCFIIIVIFIIAFLPINFLIYLIKKKKKFIIFVYIVFLIVFLFMYYYYISHFLGCKDWEKGLNNTYIENNINKYGCQIKIPKYCSYKFGKYFLDITKRSGIECGKDLTTKEKLLEFSTSKNINRNTKRIGFPLTNKDSMCLIRPDKKKKISISIYTKKNLIDMDNKKQLQTLGEGNIPEVIVDFSHNSFGEMIINVKYNESLSKERKKKEKNTNPFSNNIMILYFDSVARSTGIRQLKKTLKFFEEFMPYKGKFNKKYPSENFHSFQFFKYHSFYMYTHGNYPKLFYGMDKSENMTRITKYLKENGYITGFSNDMCLRDSCWMPHDMSKEEICDHELILCDPNMRSTNSMIKKCLYNKVNAGHQYEYGLQFWTKYEKNRKFLLIVNNDGHEGTLEILKYDDDIIFNFLNNLYNSNSLKETTILLLSDHGCPMPSVYYFNSFFRLDRNLPMLYIFTYDRKNVSYNKQYKNINENQQKFITAYDIYNTILYLMYGKDYFKKYDKNFRIIPKSKLGKPLFSRISSKRTPYNYKNMSTKTCIIIKKKINKKKK